MDFPLVTMISLNKKIMRRKTKLTAVKDFAPGSLLEIGHWDLSGAWLLVIGDFFARSASRATQRPFPGNHTTTSGNLRVTLGNSR